MGSGVLWGTVECKMTGFNKEEMKENEKMTLPGEKCAVFGKDHVRDQKKFSNRRSQSEINGDREGGGSKDQDICLLEDQPAS